MIGWAWLCFLSTLFTLLTFWVEPSRFRYPERPIVFLALCYNLLSVNYIIRGAIGIEILSCVSQLDGPSYVPVHDGLKSIPCTCWWIVKHYLSLASSTWWAILCGCWLLSARNEWSSEALHNIASYLHAVAWGLPLFATGGNTYCFFFFFCFVFYSSELYLEPSKLNLINLRLQAAYSLVK